MGGCRGCERALARAPMLPSRRRSALRARLALARWLRRCRHSPPCAIGVLSIEGGPLVSLAVSTNVLAALTGSASGGLTIALDALGDTYMRIAAEEGVDPALMHCVAVIGAGTLDSLPHNGAVVTLLAVCGSTHRESYLDILMVAIVSALIALAAVIALGSVFGSF
jgi:H+/gluconate symporter-like permease